MCSYVHSPYPSTPSLAFSSSDPQTGANFNETFVILRELMQTYYDVIYVSNIHSMLYRVWYQFIETKSVLIPHHLNTVTLQPLCVLLQHSNVFMLHFRRSTDIPEKNFIELPSATNSSKIVLLLYNNLTHNIKLSNYELIHNIDLSSLHQYRTDASVGIPETQQFTPKYCGHYLTFILDASWRSQYQILPVHF